MTCTRAILSGLLRAPLRQAGRSASARHLLELSTAATAAAPEPSSSSLRARSSPALRRPLVPTRRWSHSQAPAQTRIWEFKDVQKLVQDSRSGSTRNTVIVDAREPGELQSTGRIPTAVNIPITSQPDSFHITDDEFADRFDFPRPPRDAELVFYCKAGVRSRAAAQLARDAGWNNVGEYSGSWLDWDKNGGEVQR